LPVVRKIDICVGGKDEAICQNGRIDSVCEVIGVAGQNTVAVGDTLEVADEGGEGGIFLEESMISHGVGGLVEKGDGRTELTGNVNMVVGGLLHPVEILIILPLEVVYGLAEIEPDQQYGKDHESNDPHNRRLASSQQLARPEGIRKTVHLRF
jgi:hypothetical protein